MIPLSDRHALPVIVAMLLFAMPIGYHALSQPRVDDCASPARLLEPGLLPFSTRDHDPPRKRLKWVGKGPWGALRVDRPWVVKPRWRIVRSYDLDRFYFTPPGFYYGFFPEHTAETRWRRADGVALPIHVRVDDSEGLRNFGAYLYVFAGQPVRHPLAASLRHALRQIIGGALPLNMILVEGGFTFAHARENEKFLIDWMRSAWIEFDAVCGSRERASTAPRKPPVNHAPGNDG
jgi:hypothetical protein